jgi:hypothetical protein
VARTYDFSPLDDPIPPGESAPRRRAMLDGRSVFAELSLTRGLLLIGMVFLVWPTLALFGGTILVFLVSWVTSRGPTADWGFGAPLLLGAILVAVGLCVVLTRLLLIPPAWGRWVRMHRFAEVNGMTFLRRATGGGVATAGLGAGVLNDVFTDPVAGVVLGNAGAGVGAQAFILIQPDGSGLAPIDAQPLDGFTIREQPEGRLATRHRSVPMRDSVTVRRMFATADLVMADSYDALP